MAFEIIICKSGREGGCGSAETNPADISRYELNQRNLGNIVIDRTFCNTQMCGPRDVNQIALTELEKIGISQVTGILVSGTTRNGEVLDKAPGVITKDSSGKISSTMY